MPRAELPPRIVKVTKGGRNYNGHFYQLGDGTIRVDSAYGSQSQALGRGDPMTVAKLIMTQIVQAQRRF